MASRRQILAACAAAFCGMLVLVLLLIGFGHRLQIYGFTRPLYFLTLVTVSLCAAGFLFGVLRNSSATVRWKWAEIGGPAALAVILIYMGKEYAPPETFLLVFHIEDEQGQPIRSGSLLVDIGEERPRLSIDNRGQAQFNETPSQFGSSSLSVIPEIDGYAASWKNPVGVGGHEAVTLKVHRVAESSSLYGQIFDPSGTQPLPYATLSISTDQQAFKTKADQLGQFRFSSLPIKRGAPMSLIVSTDDKVRFSGTVLNNSPLNLNVSQ